MKFTPRLLSDGRICCSSQFGLCDECKLHFALAPDPYAAGIAAMRAAELPDQFAERYKADRLRALQTEYASMEEDHS